MIDRDTLVRIASLNGMRPYQQEKHYVQGIMLVSLSAYPLVFKGGTYLWFFHGLNRFSEDLDFTATGQMPEDLDRRVSSDMRLFGLENRLKRIAADERSFSFRLSAKGPLNTSDIDLCHVYAEISRRESVIRKPVSLKLDFPAYGIPIKMVSGMALDEVAAEKVRAIVTRNKARDVFDLSFLIQKGVLFDAKLADEKLKYYGKTFSSGDFMRAVEARKPSWAKELDSLVLGELPSFSDARKMIAEWVT